MDERRFTYLLCGEVVVRAADMHDDEAIGALASAQLGLVRRSQLLDVGVTGRAIDHRIRMGRLLPRFPGVYAVGHLALGPTAEAMAAVMATWPHAAGSHPTAASIWGFGDQPRGWPHVTAERPRRRRRGIVVHRAVLPRGEVAVVDGVPVTSVARTLLDLSGTIPERPLRRLVKRAEFDDLVTMADLAAILERYPRRRGRGTLARIVGAWASSGRTRSELEDRFLQFCRRRGLPLPEVNVAIQAGGRRYEVDCLWRQARLVVELDGRHAHDGAVSFEEDRARDRALLASGLLPMRVTWAHLHADPDALEAEIRAVLYDESRFTHTARG